MQRGEATASKNLRNASNCGGEKEHLILLTLIFFFLAVEIYFSFKVPKIEKISPAGGKKH